ncbi:sulfocyanin-like copper-binding protein [Arthrobacter sp. MW3 TE3886]|uniref:sulfocyanin-like copper-binding protein n=1 Tax=Arthrobacter sp. MW3 TE3886 TaxID=3156254 RepID=UPI003512C37D
MKTPSLRGQVILGIASVILLTALSLVAVGVVGSVVNPGGPGFLSRARCAAPNLPGPVVGVSLTNMGGPMMSRPNRMMGGAMRMTADRSAVGHGTVSFLVTNGGTISHELVILPLPENQIAGTRPIGGDAKIDESGTIGEASNTCADGAGQGILPGASGWVTVTLPPGRYELVCNLSGHYAAGMYTQLTVN